MFFDLGSALGTYIFSVALYNPKHVLSPGPLWERIDNFALIILVTVGLIYFVRKRKVVESWKIIVMIAVFLFSPLFQAAVIGNLDWYTFAQFLRMFGLPFVLFILVQSSAIRQREVESFFKVLMILGMYMAVVAILEKLSLFGYLSQMAKRPQYNSTIGTGRSGGPLMQSEFNGLALGLILVIYWSSIFFGGKGWSLIKYIGLILCIIGIYLSYTRAAWLSVLVALILLIYAKSDVSTGLYKKVMIICILIILFTGLIVSPSQLAQERAGDMGTVNFRINLGEPP